MDVNDLFLYNDSEVDVTQESEMKVKEIIVDDCVFIGEPKSKVTTPVQGTSFNEMSKGNRVALLNLVASRGYYPDKNKEEISRSSKHIFEFSTRDVPEAHDPHINTEISFESYFHKLTREMATMGVDSVSVSFNSPIINNEFQFKEEKKRQSNSSSINEYLLAKYIVKKASLEISASNYTINPDFVQDLREAVKDNYRTLTGCCNLLRVLNVWGYYIPVEFSLGGALYSCDTKSVTEFSESKENKNTLKNDFSASFWKIGGGVAFERTTGTTLTEAELKSSRSLLVSQIGGEAGSIIGSNNYGIWAKTLNDARNWVICDVKKMQLTLSLIERIDSELFSICILLLKNYYIYDDIKKLQTQIDLNDYAIQLQKGSIFTELYR